MKLRMKSFYKMRSIKAFIKGDLTEFYFTIIKE